jgi:hypothetical protein
MSCIRLEGSALHGVEVVLDDSLDGLLLVHGDGHAVSHRDGARGRLADEDGTGPLASVGQLTVRLADGARGAPEPLADLSNVLSRSDAVFAADLSAEVQGEDLRGPSAGDQRIEGDDAEDDTCVHLRLAGGERLVLVPHLADTADGAFAAAGHVLEAVEETGGPLGVVLDGGGLNDGSLNSGHFLVDEVR